jgi:hypothetical protein
MEDDRSEDPEAQEAEEKTSSTGELSLTSSPEVVLRPRKEAAMASAGKSIHPRRPLPPVPSAPTAEEEEKEEKEATRPGSGEVPPE